MTTINQDIATTVQSTRVDIDRIYAVADQQWKDTIKTVADIARDYGIDPTELRIVNTEEDYGDVRLSVRRWDNTKFLHDDDEVVSRFLADAEYLLDNSLFTGFFERDADFEDYHRIRLV